MLQNRQTQLITQSVSQNRLLPILLWNFIFTTYISMQSGRLMEGRGGLTTEEGLQILVREIERLVCLYKEKLEKRKWRIFVSFMYGDWSCYTLLSLTCVFFMAFLLILSSAMTEEDRFASGSRGWIILEALFLLFSIVVNMLLIGLKLKKCFANYIGLKVKLVQDIYDCLRNNIWTSGIYPDLHAPISPCISLQWCMRDGKPINLPTPLLVQNDVIIMRPGFPAPGICQSIKDDTKLQAGEIYSKNLPSNKGKGPQRRTPLKAEQFLLQETPVLNNLRLMFEDKILRPQSFLENERSIICNTWLERRLLPIVLVIVFMVNALRCFYIDENGAHWSEMMLILQIHTILPLAAVIFPLLWITVNTYGQAHLHAAFDVCKSLKEKDDISESISSCSNISIEEARVSITYTSVLKGFWSLFMGRQETPCPNFEMLHTFGSVTAFCCLDKKGILSWPNPSVEKVLFFSSLGRKETDTEDIHVDNLKGKLQKKGHQNRKKMKPRSDSDPGYNIQVLDLTNEPSKNGFGIVFDDPRWKDHLNALKPLGLSIVLNTCNHQTSTWYSQFTDHVSCATKSNKDTIAVVNRRFVGRCMCHLSQAIGFTNDADNAFNYENIFGLYRQVPVEESEKVHRARSTQQSQRKIPMPNQVSVLVRDKLSGMCQLLSQGTGDLVLDCCSDVWTGTDLQILSEVDRKRILDFYHRNSLMAYCTAFAYKPVPKALEDWTDDDYTELVESPSTTKQAHGEDVGVFFDGEDGEPNTRLRFYSMDSLLEMSPNSSMEDVGIGRMLQSHQVFIGMVSLQYQARQDFVQLIDQLESACIRFVHFSKENEVRSRVFSEKLGLEAGWNCHVSLMSRESIASASSSCKNLSSMTNINTEADQGMASPPTVPRTHSAPSFVNTEEIQVKFAKDLSPIVIDEGNNLSNIPTVICTTTSMAFAEVDCDNTENTSLLKKKSACKNSDRSSPSESDEKVEDKTGNNPREGTKALLSNYKEKNDGEDSQEESSDDDDREEEEELDFQSDSRYTSSYITENTEDSLTGPLDNRAHLPQGIENIRPHLQNVDNVPLLVNLFTDCSPEATCEMVKIMQENGEVVLALGSSLNINNTSVFLQADCSITIEPLFPQLCGMKPSASYSWNEEIPSPTQLASRLVSLPCPLYFQREDNIKLIQLIMEARHYVFAMRNCFYLMLCCMLAVTLAQVMCTLLFLPPLMSVPHLLWLSLIVIPALSLSLIGNPNEARTMSMATHKNILHLNGQMVCEFLVQFSTRFIPSIFMTILYFASTLHSFCENVATTHCSVYDFKPVSNSSNFTGSSSWTHKFQGGLVLAQNIFHIFFIFYLVVISMSLVHWQDHLWQRLPFKNIVWSITACSLLVAQIIFSVADVYARHTWFGEPLPLSEVHPFVWVLGCCWPFVIVALNELAKRRDIKLAVRRQRRARLDFDTKLGMNSPF